MRGLTDMPRLTLKSQAATHKATVAKLQRRIKEVEESLAVTYDNMRRSALASEERHKKEIVSLSGLLSATRARVEELSFRFCLNEPYFIPDRSKSVRVTGQFGLVKQAGHASDSDRRRAMEAVSGF